MKLMSIEAINRRPNMNIASARLGIFGSANAEITQPKTTKEEESMSTTVGLESTRSTDTGAIRSFKVHVPEAELTELRKRVQATKWPERETVSDATQGVQLATVQALALYWATEYDWRK